MAKENNNEDFIEETKELDQCFIGALKNILRETEDCLEYIKDWKGKDYQEIKEDYAYIIDDLTDLLDNIRTLNELAELDDETIGSVLDYLEEYYDNFIISSEPEQQKKDLEEYGKLEKLIGMFIDEDDIDE